MQLYLCEKCFSIHMGGTTKQEVRALWKPCTRRLRKTLECTAGITDVFRIKTLQTPIHLAHD